MPNQNLKFKKEILALILAIGLCLILGVAFLKAQTGIPQVINYHGKLKDATGNPLSGTYDFTFRLYDTETRGNSVWGPETHNSVTVTNGYFNVKLGSILPFDLDFLKPYWLSIEVNNDGEMSPRVQLTSFGYAFTAQELYRQGANLAIQTTASGNIILKTAGNIQLLDGNVGIGTTTPVFTLDVAGDVQMTGFKMSTGAQAGYVLTSDASGLGTWQASVGGGAGGWTDDGTVVRLTTDTDNVGIGTLIPQDALHIIRNFGGLTLDTVNWRAPSRILFQNAGTPRASIQYQYLDGISFRTGTPGDIRMSIKEDGSIGIGTVSPQTKLDVAGTVQMIGFKMPTGAQDGYVLTSDSTGVGTWQSPESSGLSWPLLASDGTAEAPSYSFINNSNLGLFRPVTNTLAFTTDGIERMRVDSSGNIGIGTTTPVFTLDVTGNIRTVGSSSLTTFLINQQGSGDILELQKNNNPVLLVTNEGDFNLKSLKIKITGSQQIGGTSEIINLDPNIITTEPGKAVKFQSGVFNQEASIPHSSSLVIPSQITIEFWVYIDQLPIMDAAMISKGSYATSDEVFVVTISDGSVLTAILNSNGTLGGRRYVYIADTPVNTWYHIAVTYDGTIIKLYYNGSAVNSQSWSMPLYTGGTAPIRIGNWLSSWQLWGRMDEVRIYNRAISEEEVLHHYNDGAGRFGQPEEGLVGGWHFDEETGIIANDYSGNNNHGTLINGPEWVEGKVFKITMGVPFSRNILKKEKVFDKFKLYFADTQDDEIVINKPLFKSPIENTNNAIAYTLDTEKKLTATNTKLLSIRNQTAEKFVIDKDGNVGIGTTAPAKKLHVKGATMTDMPGTKTPWAVCKTTQTGTTDEELVDCATAAAADYAEIYPVEQGLESGDLVAPSNTIVTTTQGHNLSKLTKTKEAYQSTIIGIVSDLETVTDFNVIGYNVKEEDNPMPVALSGRVLVKVSTENGEIQIGNLLTSSSQPGVAMKATKAGRVIGIALEPFIEDGPLSTGKIMVFVNPHWYAGQLTEDGLLTVDEELTKDGSLTTGFIKKIKQALASLGLFIENGIAQIKELIAEKITAQKARLDKIEMVDQATGETYCTWIENGEWVKIKGECQEIETDPISEGPPPVEDVCDSTHLNLCLTEADCDNAGGYWRNDACNAEPAETPAEPEGPVCTNEHLDLCTTQELCEGAKLYWYNDICNLEPEMISTPID